MNISESNFYENSGRHLVSRLFTFFYQIDSIKTLAKDVFYLEVRLELCTLTSQSFCERARYLGFFNNP